MTQKLFEPITLGDISLKNRMVMAPLTRGRAGESRIPNDLMAEYYSQRASAGLIITEATAVSKQGYGWYGAPGAYTDEQFEGWRKTTNAVHEQNGKIVMQLWHMGRVSHPDFQDGELPVGPSAVAAEGDAHTPNGKQPYVVPRALETAEIKSLTPDYVTAARRAIDAGFDGVEIHAANGYLLDQFIRDGSNKRDDEYGGSIENRIRLPLEITKAVAKEIGAGLVGIRISPTNPFNTMDDSDPVATFTTLAKKLNALDLAYLHVMEPISDEARFYNENAPYVTPHIRELYNGNLMVNGSYDKEKGIAAIEQNNADAIAYGVPFLANPDLVERYKKNAPLNEPNQDTFYQGKADGYTDYPTLKQLEKAA